jgi:DNA adenine methylase
MALALMKYPGGKAKTVPLFRSYLDPWLSLDTTTEYHEIFVGGGPILLSVAQAFPNLSLYVNDLDENMFSFWSVLGQSSDEEFFELLRRLDISPTIEMFWEERERSKSQERTRLEKAFHAMFFHKTTFGGQYSGNPIGGREQKSKYAVNCHYTAKNIIRKLGVARKLLYGRLSVTNLHVVDYLAVLQESGVAAVTYLDPPYYGPGPSLYPVFMTETDHQAMAGALRTLPGHWVLSYDDHPRVRELYPWAAVTTVPFRYSSTNHGKKRAWKDQNELIIQPPNTSISPDKT